LEKEFNEVLESVEINDKSENQKISIKNEEEEGFTAENDQKP